MDTEIAWEDCITDLPLDSANLPPLNALSSSSSEDLPQLQLLDLFTIDTSDPSNLSDHTPRKPYQSEEIYPHLNLTSLEAEKLSQCTSTPSDSSAISQDMKPGSPISDNASTTSSPHQDSKDDSLKELNERLRAAGNETCALRKRVAALTAENRGLRAALDHANARLVAVAQAAAAQPPASSPVVYGLAQLSSDVAHRLGAALTVSDTTESEPNRKKRKRVTTGAATTMACVMFMWGALVGTPGLLKSGEGSYRSQGNLPAVWNSKETAVAPTIPRLPQSATGPSWQPNCMRVLKQLPDGKEEMDVVKEVKEEVKEVKVKEEAVLQHEIVHHEAGNSLFVDMEDGEAAKMVAKADESQHPEYSYVLCRDAASALDNVKSCASRMRHGQTCGQPHVISLILPAEAVGLQDNETSTRDMEPALAEVQCSITSVARIPMTAAASSMSKYGRIIATVPESMKANVRKAK